MEVRVAQPGSCNAVHGRGGYDATERAWRTETLVVRHNEQHVGCAFRRHDARRPPGLRVRSLFVDHTAEFRSGGGICFPVIVVVAPGAPDTPVVC